MNIEPLEPRIAPASLTNGGTLLTYTDFDGDLVKITFTNAVMAEGNFAFAGGFLPGDTATKQKLDTVNLAGKTGAGFTLTATPKNNNMGELRGDSHANILEIVATNTDVGAIRMDGDLMRILAGDGDFANGPGVKSLSVLSMGKDFSGAGSVINGLGSLKIKTDLTSAVIEINGGAKSITIGGSMIGTGTVNLGAIIVESGDLGSLKIGGSIHGNIGSGNTGNILVKEDVGTLSIRGSIIGSESTQGAFATNPQVRILGDVKSFTVGRDITGRSDGFGGYVEIAGNVGAMKVGGSLRASDSSSTGVIHIVGNATSVSIGGDLIGGSSRGGNSLIFNGAVHVDGSLGSLSLGGDFVGGGILDAGGSMPGSSMIAVGGILGSAKIGGSVLGHSTRPAYIMGGGDVADPTAAAIQSLTVKGSVTEASIVTGYLRTFLQDNLLAGIGSVTIGGDLAASNIIAGSNKGADNVPGNRDDVTVNSTTTIRSVKIGGAFIGSGANNFPYYIYAPHILNLKVGKASYTDADLLVEDGIIFTSAGVAIAYSDPA